MELIDVCVRSDGVRMTLVLWFEVDGDDISVVLLEI